MIMVSTIGSCMLDNNFSEFLMNQLVLLFMDDEKNILLKGYDHNMVKDVRVLKPASNLLNEIPNQTWYKF